MVFPDYYFFAERRLVNHNVEEKRVKNLDNCELLCKTKKIQKTIKEVTSVNLITSLIWNMTESWQLMLIFTIVARR